jgi:hypothetical protein
MPSDDVRMLPKLSESVAFVLLETMCSKPKLDIYPAPQLPVAQPADVIPSEFQQLRCRAKEQSTPFALVPFAGAEQ